MLNFPLIHQPTLAALASLGHGSQVLIADGNYPFATAMNPAAALVHLGLRPGLPGVDTVLETLREAVELEAASLMATPDGAPMPAQTAIIDLLAPGTPITRLDRAAFYSAVRGPDVGLVIATGDQRSHANVLLTLGFRAA